MEIRSLYNRHIAMRLGLIILCVLVLALLVLGYFFFEASLDFETKLATLLGGLVAALVAVVIQFFLAWIEYREVERMRSMGFLKILTNREDRKRYYGNLLRGVDQEIDFLGKTAHRFLEDFAYEDPRAEEPDGRLLIDALNRGISIRFLISSTEHLEEEKKQQLEGSLGQLEKLKERYPNQLDFKLLSERPTQTLVRVDNQCIFGPVFPNIDSRVTPAVHADTFSPFLKQYLNYFNNEWLDV